MELFAVCWLLRGKVNAYDQKGKLIGKITGATRSDSSKGFIEENMNLYIEGWSYSKQLPLNTTYYRKEEIEQRVKEVQDEINELKLLPTTSTPLSQLNMLEEEIAGHEKSIELFLDFTSKRFVS